MFDAIDAVLQVVVTAAEPRFDGASWWLFLLLVLGVVWFAAFSISLGAVTAIAWPGAGLAALAALLLVVRPSKSSRRAG